MWKWKLLKDAGADAAGAATFVMRVPGGYVLRVQHRAVQGRGPDYAGHPISTTESMVFVPFAEWPGIRPEDQPPCD